MAGEAGSEKPLAGAAGSGSQRLDQWLFFARIVKSRTLAATLIGEGKFRINREKVEKPSTAVKPGDVVTSSAHRTVRLLKVAKIGTRRGPAIEAQALYEDVTPPPPPTESRPPEAGTRDPGTGRPTKRERRLIDKIRGRY